MRFEDRRSLKKKRYRAIRRAAEKSGGKLTVYCRIANINRKNYYDFLKHNEEPEDEEILDYIKEKQLSRNYGIGYRPMTDLVRQKFRIEISGKKILSLMKENALLSTVRRKRFTPEEYNRMRKIREEVPENLLKRNFFALESNKKYVSDITYLYGKECVMYLSMIEDLFNEEIVAWKISEHPDEELCGDTLDLLAANRKLKGAVFHTDQGSTYLSIRFKEKIMALEMRQSCSARGVCWDNAAMESANGVLKTECIYNKFVKSRFKNRQIPIDDVVAEIAPFIEYYNNERPKQSLGGLSPVQFRKQNPKGTYLMVIKD